MNLAPNGKPSNLTDEQYKIVRTPAFISWFGDWENDAENSSKVVDENGEPMVVYHGTSKDFYIFGEGKNKDILEEYQEQYNFKKKVNYFHKNKEYAETFGSKYGGYEKPFFLDIKKIEVVEENEIEDIGYWKNIYDYYVILRNLDGINSKSGQYATLLNPHQIKLADGTNTTFDANNPDIRYKEGGNLTDELSLVLRGVTNENKYKGNYKKIFDIIEKEIVFYNPYGTEKEELVGDNFYITITPRPENNIIEKISKLKNVEVVNQKFKTGGTTKAFAYSIGGL